MNNIPIEIRLKVEEGQGNDQFTNNLVKGYFLQALRRIPDVVIVENNEMYAIRVLPSKVLSDTYTIMFIVTNRFKFDVIAPWIIPEGKELVKGLLEVGDGACHIDTYGFFSASKQTLEERCKSFIVQFDAGQLQPLREARQKLIRDIQSGNP